jgi:hypothetical protein
METLSALDQYKATQLPMNLHNVLLIDSLWTQQVKQLSGGTTEDLQILDQMANDLDRLLALIHDDISWLQKFIEPHLKETFEVFNKLVSESRLDDTTRRVLRERFATADMWIDQVVGSLQTILNDTAQEREEIAEKRKQISAGRASQGDISQNTRCAILLAGAVAGVALTFGGFVFAGGFAMGLYGSSFADEC